MCHQLLECRWLRADHVFRPPGMTPAHGSAVAEDRTSQKTSGQRESSLRREVVSCALWPRSRQSRMCALRPAEAIAPWVAGLCVCLFATGWRGCLATMRIESGVRSAAGSGHLPRVGVSSVGSYDGGGADGAAQQGACEGRAQVSAPHGTRVCSRPPIFASTDGLSPRCPACRPGTCRPRRGALSPPAARVASNRTQPGATPTQKRPGSRERAAVVRTHCLGFGALHDDVLRVLSQRRACKGDDKSAMVLARHVPSLKMRRR